MMPFFSVEDLSASYGKRRVLEGVSFSLEKGSLTGLLGANGCGKSTLLKAICNQLPHGGRCKLDGCELAHLHVRELARQVSYIPQRSGVSISLPALDVVMMGFNPRLGMLAKPSAAQREMARGALGRVGLAGRENDDYLALSEGQRQLCILARTLIEDTKLLLLDEPDSALDFYNRNIMLSQLKNLICAEGSARAGLICLHDPNLALNFCEQLVLIKNGRCICTLRPREDSTETMHAALREIYGEISLVMCRDGMGRERLVMLADI